MTPPAGGGVGVGIGVGVGVGIGAGAGCHPFSRSPLPESPVLWSEEASQIWGVSSSLQKPDERFRWRWSSELITHPTASCMTHVSFTWLRVQIGNNPPGKRLQDVPPTVYKPSCNGWRRWERDTVLITNTIAHRTPTFAFDLWDSGQPLCAAVKWS